MGNQEGQTELELEVKARKGFLSGDAMVDAYIHALRCALTLEEERRIHPSAELEELIISARRLVDGCRFNIARKRGEQPGK